MFNEWGWQYVFVNIKYVRTLHILCNNQPRMEHIFTQMMSRICAQNGAKNKTSEYVQRMGLAMRICRHKICKINVKNMVISVKNMLIGVKNMFIGVKNMFIDYILYVKINIECYIFSQNFVKNMCKEWC